MLFVSVWDHIHPYLSMVNDAAQEIAPIFGGVIAGGSAVGIYFLQQYLKHNRNKSDYARILHHEVLNISKIHFLRMEPNAFRIPLVIPGDEIYKGLLMTGNIRYFQTDLVTKLASLYDYFKIDQLNPNQDLCIEIIQDLEKMCASRFRRG